LVLQALLIPSLFPSLRSGQVLPIKIKFQGGATDTFFSPPIDYFRFVFLPMLKKIIGSLPNPKGGEIKINILKRGFYPEGGAEVEVEVTPLEIFQTPHQPPHQILVGDGTGPVQHRASLWCWEKEKTLSLENRGELKRILVISGASDSLKEKKVAERQIRGTRETPLFYKKAKLPIETKIEYYDSFSTGSQIIIIGEFEESILGASALGKIGKSSEEVGKEAAMEFLRETKELVFVDKHFSDQILPYIALLTKSAKITTSEITQHTKTNIWVIEKFTQYRDKVSGSGFINGKFGIKENIISWKS
jgi:RNA 3'-terminal phosphate cyclase